VSTAEQPISAFPFHTEPSSVDVRGLRTAYRRSGDGEPLLHLPGVGLSRRWLPFYEALARGVDVIVPDHPGFGDTPLPEWLDGFDDVVLHYADLLDALELEAVHLSGHSLGAWIAAEVAVYMPERLRSLTLISPIGLRGSNLVDPFRLEPEELWELQLNGQADDYAEYLEDGDPVEALVQRYAEGIAHARLAWNPRYDLKLERRLGRVSCAALVIVPDDDRFASTEQMRRYAELIPGARTEKIHGVGAATGHASIVQEPERLAAMICAFVDETATGRGQRARGRLREPAG
jgi:pimeloyl-ACP methyl ester carboxylesterase